MARRTDASMELVSVSARLTGASVVQEACVTGLNKAVELQLRRPHAAG